MGAPRTQTSTQYYQLARFLNALPIDPGKSTREYEGRNPTMKTYDAIVVGAGHNGLTNAAYLAKSGLDVLCLDPDAPDW